MIELLDAGAFLERGRDLPVVDVRSPLEFQKGHIPGAYNLHLFDDDERALLGYLYVQKSQEEAIQKGLQIAGMRLDHYLDRAVRLAPGRKICVHCWRGGMRSQSFAELLSERGFDVVLLRGGYKSYRTLVTAAFATQLPLIVLGGMTGSGKTRILKALATKGFQVIDLEGLAHHKGSVFGAMNQGTQPVSQQFENDLYEVWHTLDLRKPVLIEDENYDIGQVKLPYALWQQIRTAPLLEIRVPQDRRIHALMEEYSAQHDELLIEGIRRILRRLGSEAANQAINAVIEKQYRQATEILLDYYDKSYLASIDKRPASRIFSRELSGNLSEEDVSIMENTIHDIFHGFYV